MSENDKSKIKFIPIPYNRTIITSILTTVLGGSILGHFSWLVSVEKRLGVEDRVEKLEQRLEPMLIDWLLEKKLIELEEKSPTAEQPPKDPVLQLYKEQAVRDIHNWRAEQRAITEKK